MLQDIVAAVNALTLPVYHQHWQDLGPGAGGRKLHTSYAPALLDQLYTSLGSGGGTGAGGVGEKRARAIMDFAGLELWESIRSEVHIMLTELGAGGTQLGEVKDELRRWMRLLMRYGSTVYLPASDERYQKRQLGILRGWVNTIESRFDPARTAELLIPCPECHERYTTDGIGDRISAVVALIRPELIKVVCRSCGQEWVGTKGIILLGEKVV